MDDARSFVAEPGWYHEAHEAFVPASRDGGFFIFRLLKQGMVNAVSPVINDLQEHSEESVKEETPWNG